MNRNIIFKILSIIVMTSLVLGPATGKTLENVNGWGVEAPVQWCGRRRKYKKRRRGATRKTAGYWAARCKSWQVPLTRSILMGVLWQLSGGIGPDWIALMPWVIWLLPEGRGLLGKIRESLWQIQRMLLLGYVGLSAYHWLGVLLQQGNWGIWIGLGCVVCGAEPRVEVKQTEEGDWQIDLNGHFTLRVSDEHPFRLRLMIIFLGLLQSEHDERRSRRTRDGRTPFVRQEQLAEWTHTKQEHISMWMRDWTRGDWANLLSLKTAQVLTHELVERIVTVFATYPDWSNAQVYAHLQRQGCQVSHAQIEQASAESGWQRLIGRLRECYDLKAGLKLRDEWLVSQLLSQIQMLVAKLEALGALTPEERITLADVQTLSAQAGVIAKPPLAAQPWLLALERTVLGDWEPVTDAKIVCTYCGSPKIAPKSNKPRLKTFMAANGQVQEVEVLRYYCHNPQCSKKSFTHFPAGLTPYSPYRAQVHLLVLQMYAWGYSTYRRSGTALGVHSMTAWRWVQAWGHDLLPVAALFGVVRSSGVVGVDEKYVLVPKNDKPDGKMRRWMYVYVAVDAWTYDLLHIDIYPHNDEVSAIAFLFALRAKGYHPDVIVTDLRQDYGPCIAKVFPGAQHHECIFHALQNVQKYVKQVYGPLYTQDHPQAVLLKQQIYAIFDTASPQEALSRYQQVLNLKEAYLKLTPDAVLIFDFIQRHWPKLLNAVGSPTIPTTNNATERLILRFDQHYQNFGGFDSIASAHAYLAVFEKIYRFTPFSQDALPRIRGKSPLQLAGYDVSNIPFSALCSGLSFDWPTEAKLVPN